MDEAVKTNESAASSLRFLKKSLEKYPAHRAKLIATALQTFAADEEIQHRVIYVARKVFPDETTALVEKLMRLGPDAVASLGPAFLVDTTTMRAALAEFRGNDTNGMATTATADMPLEVVADGTAAPAETAIDASPTVPTAATFSLAVDESMVDPATVVDTSFHLSSQKRSSPTSLAAPSLEDPAKELVRDQIKLSEASASVDESSLNNSLEFDEADEGDFAKSAVRIDDAWKPSEDIYLDESKFEKRRLAAAKEAVQHAPEERAELEFQSTVDHQETGFGRPPLSLPAIGPEL